MSEHSGRLAAPRLGVCVDLRAEPGETAATRAAEVLDWAVRAERDGLSSIWCGEHHGFPDGHLSQPLLFCAALAARTTALQVGSAVAIAPLQHPVALAEQIAWVDAISDGRLQVGLGAGWKPDEFAAFDVPFTGRYDALESHAARLQELWDDRVVTPAPARRPYPLWIGGRGPRAAGIAGTLGAGLLWVDPALLPPYLAGLRAAGRPVSSARMGGMVNLVVADDPAEVWDAVRDRARKHAATMTRSGVRLAAAAAPRLQVLTVPQAVDHLVELVHGLPVSDLFVMERPAGLPPSFAGRHLDLIVQRVAPLLQHRLRRDLTTDGVLTWRRTDA